jgi:hypothetical protein
VPFFVVATCSRLHGNIGTTVRRFELDGKTSEVILKQEDIPATDDKAEKGTRSHVDSVQSAVFPETQQEDEKFEWREVKRGKLHLMAIF